MPIPAEEPREAPVPEEDNTTRAEALGEIARALGLPETATPEEILRRARALNAERAAGGSRVAAPPAEGGAPVRFRNGSDKPARVVYRDGANVERTLDVPAGAECDLPADLARVVKDIAPQLVPVN